MDPIRAVQNLKAEHNLPDSFVKRMEAVIRKHMSSPDSTDSTGSTNDETLDSTDEESDVYSEVTELSKGLPANLAKALKRGHARARAHTSDRTVADLQTRLQATEDQLRATTSRCASVRDELQQLRTEKVAVEETYRAREEQLKALAEKTTEKLAALQGEARSFRETLKDGLHERMFIGQETAAILRAKRYERLDLIEYVQLRVFEKMQERYKSRDDDDQASAAAHQDLLHARQEVDRLGVRLSDQLALNERLKDEFSRKTARAEQQAAAVEAELEQALRKIDADREQARAATLLAEEHEANKHRVARLTAENVALAAKAQSLELGLAAAKADLSCDASQAKHTVTELHFAKKEAAALAARIAGIEQEKSDLTQKLIRVQETAAGDAARHAAEVLAIKRDCDDKLIREIDRLQTTGENDLHRLTEHTKALADRENAHLHAERDLAAQSAKTAARRVQEVEQDLKSMTAEFRIREEGLNASLSAARADLKVKATEVQQLLLVRDEHERAVEALHLEARCSAKKLDTLKAEFYELQLQHSRQLAEANARAGTLKEQLKMYAELESEFDSAVEATGHNLPDLPLGSPSALALSSHTLSHVPAAPQRRIQHCLVLAQKALKLEREVAETQAALRTSAGTEAKLKAELARVRASCGHPTEGQPYQYFIDTLEAREDELKAAAGRIDAFSAENGALRAAVETLSGQLAALKEQRDELSRYLQQQLHAAKLAGHRKRAKDPRETKPASKPRRQPAVQYGQYIATQGPGYDSAVPGTTDEEEEAGGEQPFTISA
ncbi:hypothetical protein DIPPA_15339 [Diplonema papillatum]|nr:hypothetical protein DIPPA_15339 [Diplonema papillatum]